MTDFLPYGRQEILDEDVDAVAAALREPLITQGPGIARFEAAFARATGATHAVAFSSGTAALHAAAAAAGLGPGDEVLTTPISFVASSNCALFVGARPRFFDVDARTANLDLARAVSAGAADGVSAAITVSMAGLPASLAGVDELRERGVTVIEDACHALGGLRDGRPVGGAGQADMTAFSLHPVKAITAGEGGMVTTERDDLAESLRRFRTHGIQRGTPSDDPLRGGWHYDVTELAFNYRITDFQCALGASQLARLDDFIGRRNQVATWYRERLAGVDGVTLPAEPPPDGRHAYHLFVVRFPEGAARRRAVYDFLHANEIGPQLHYIPIYRHSLYRSLGYADAAGQCPEAERYYAQALSLPMFPAMSRDDVERVAVALEGALAEPLG